MKRMKNDYKLNIHDRRLPRYTERITAIFERTVLTEVYYSSYPLSKSPKAFQRKNDTKSKNKYFVSHTFLYDRISRNSGLIKFDYQNACNIRYAISMFFVIFTHGLRFHKLSSLSLYNGAIMCVTFGTWCSDLLVISALRRKGVSLHRWCTFWHMF
jgi:hypothetical protein